MLATFFEDIVDFRRPQGQKYKLHDLLVFSTLAFLCNAKSYRDIARFIHTHFDALKTDFNLNWQRPPAYTTIRNAICGVDCLELEAAFRAFTQSLLRYGLTEHGQSAPYIAIAIDGKTLRGSPDYHKDLGALHKLFFFDQSLKLILGHVDMGSKTSEIEGAQNLLAELEFPGALFTLDALHCQKKLLPRPANQVTGSSSKSRITSNSSVRIWTNCPLASSHPKPTNLRSQVGMAVW